MAISLRRLQALEQQYQRAIEQIRGVTTARVMLDDHGDAVEIHVISDKTRAPKPIVRDIETLLLARYAVRVDYRRVSLVQIDADAAAQQSPENRLQFISADADPTDGQTVQVVLQAHADRYAGSAPEVESEAGRAAADATLAAVQQAIGRAIPLTVQRTQLVEGEGQPVCLAVIRATVDGGEEQLTGTCLVTGSIWEAASKATLDAINRRLPVWTRQTGAAGQDAPLSTDDVLRGET